MFCPFKPADLACKAQITKCIIVDVLLFLSWFEILNRSLGSTYDKICAGHKLLFEEEDTDLIISSK